MKGSSFLSQVRPGCFRVVVHAKPGARSSALSCRPTLADAALEVRVAAPPVEGKANAELVEFMQSLLEQQLRFHTRVGLASSADAGVVDNDTVWREGGNVEKNKNKKNNNNNNNNVKNKKKSEEECVGSTEKLRVSLVSGATARHKVLEVTFGGTQEELFSLLESADTTAK
ncbi:uncharacterized protein TM35_000014090 [Trypanosoma theileri]|uniref:Uncharacterized protein n=1 Tax=Trypanosoma theileri TaxID=67003 RepID=A0A1X0P9D1_9TRYP|nr:uncharacterized protein TM35_000014090 [Trypanosoma theileri]ORC93532.1 hypothetical protein TM35_000014090 [Trypanosoma theileri]